MVRTSFLFNSLSQYQKIKKLYSQSVKTVAVSKERGIDGEKTRESLFFGLCLRQFIFALGGFFTYSGMTFEKFRAAFIRSELLYPEKLVFRLENLYAKALGNSSVRCCALIKTLHNALEQVREGFDIPRTVQDAAPICRLIETP